MPKEGAGLERGVFYASLARSGRVLLLARRDGLIHFILPVAKTQLTFCSTPR